MFNAGIAAVRPDCLIPRSIALSDTHLTVCGQAFPLDSEGRLIVVGAGKASGAMAQALDQLAGDRIHAGLVVVKHGHAADCRTIEIIEAGHPWPDVAGLTATKRILELCRSCGEKDTVICLLSGGGSALLADCPDDVSLTEWIAFSKALVNSGAAIAEINTVRKHLSRIKGGQLALQTWPARMVSLAISDVVGDRLDVIASGPAVADPSTFADALEVLRKHNLEPATPRAIIDFLQQGAQGKQQETPKPGDPRLERAANFIIGRNRTALEAALRFAENNGLRGRIVTDSLEGDTVETAETVVRVAFEHQGDAPFCLLFGGEPCLKVAGTGKGGRNQHLALVAAKLLREHNGITVLSAGTDGTDGPTSAAGALVDGQTWDAAIEAGLDPEVFLEDFDSYGFFERCGGHIVTGPTMTNVMDIMIVVLA